MSTAHTLLCTVGTSLFGNLRGLKSGDRPDLSAAFDAKDWAAVARGLAQLPADARTCGAEINSVASMVALEHVSTDAGLFFFHSDTDDGRAIAGILVDYFRRRGHTAEGVIVADLQDTDPKRFRTKGLRELARRLCRVIRDYSPAACAINATGGYKAQIAIAVLIGQAVGVPVYYKHELFSEIIAFPPMPIALDFEVWMRSSGMLYALERDAQLADAFADEWDERYESLVERVEIDGADYVELSATGQIFHETFRERFRSQQDRVLPPPAPPSQKRPPVLKSDEGHMLAHRADIERHLQAVTDEVPCVIYCMTTWFQPGKALPTQFRLYQGQVQGVYTNGQMSIKFRVETTATTDGQRSAAVAALNEWLEARK